MQTMPSAPASAVQGQAQPRYEITEKDKARQQAIADAWKAYDGEFDDQLKKTPENVDPNVKSNRCKIIVDRGVEFLFDQELSISVKEGSPQESQDLIDNTWMRKEKRMILLQELAMNGALGQRAFLRIVPERNKTFRLVTVDPATVFVQTAPQDCETVLLYCIEYSETEQINGRPQQIFYREEIARIDPDQDGDDGDPFADVDATWSIQHWSRVGDRGPWTPAGEAIAWPYSFPPLFSCKNLPRPNSFWGGADITKDIIDLNMSLNLLQSCVQIDEVIYGEPILYSTGTGNDPIQRRPGYIVSLPLPDSKIVAVPIASDTANALVFTDNLRSDMDELSGVPGVATGRLKDMPRGNVSGIALELLFMSILKKTYKKRCLYGGLIIDVCKALFVLAGMSSDIDVTLAWQNPLPHDDLQSAQSALAKKQIGISDTTLQRELGYDPDEEQQLSQSEDAQKLVNFTRGQGMPPSPPTAVGMQGEQGQSMMQQGGQGESPFLGGGR